MGDLLTPADFVRKHWPLADYWPEKRLEEWLSWAAGQQFLFLAYDRPSDMNIVGLAVGRPLRFADQYTLKDYAFDLDGQTIFLDLVIAPTKPILKALGCALTGRFGPRKFIAFHRKGRFKKHDYNSARQLLLK